MVDVSESADSARVKLSSCLHVLNQLDVDSKRVLLVLNKIDLLTEARHERIEEDSQFRNFQAVRVSAVRGDGLHKLRSRALELIRAPKARS
jgi:50S ribosomal subunit-associated GTPase HflX